MQKAIGRSLSYWQKKAQHFSNLYDSQSPANIPSRIVAKFLKDRTDVLLSLLPASPIHHLLDLGCGSGEHIKLLSPRCRRITGIDYSKQMLDIARVNLKKMARKNWRLVHADAEKIPFPPHTFDVVIAMGLIDYVPNPKKVLSECRRVMTEDGTLVISIPKKPSIFSLLRNPLGNVIKRIIFHLPPIDNAYTRSELIALFALSGFTLSHMNALWGAMWMVKAKPDKRNKI